jgi:hypothetical protein
MTNYKSPGWVLFYACLVEAASATVLYFSNVSLAVGTCILYLDMVSLFVGTAAGLAVIFRELPKL